MSETRNITPEAIEEPSVQQPKANSSSFDTKNYLNVKLDKDKDTRSTKIRLLTINYDSNKPFEHIYMHNVKVPTEIAPSGWKSYVCLEKTAGEFNETLGHKCPFCELNRSAYNKSVELTKKADESTDSGEKAALLKEAKTYKDISIANIASEVGIIRCIERGKEDDGPKFWKFPLRKDKKDPENIIRKLYQTRKEECIDEGIPVENILDIDEGYDLKVTVDAVYDSSGKKTKKTSINIERYGNMKPLTTDEEKKEEWLNDKKVWSDVFVAKPYEYLEVIIDGEIPWFDRKTGKWIPKASFEKNTGVPSDEVDKSSEAIEKAKENITKKASAMEKNSNAVDDDESLPF